jgi:hypothetical protein
MLQDLSVWEDDIKNVVENMTGGLDRINLAQDRDHQLPVVKTVIFWLYNSGGAS